MGGVPVGYLHGVAEDFTHEGPDKKGPWASSLMENCAGNTKIMVSSSVEDCRVPKVIRVCFGYYHYALWLVKKPRHQSER